MRKKSTCSPTTIVVDTDFVHWPQEMLPGHAFAWTMPGDGSVFYSIVLDTDPEVVRMGYRLTRTYGGPMNGQKAFVLQDLATLLLSQEQLNLARTLGWPQDQNGFHTVCAVPPS
jgi:hypothetical protein